MKRGYLTPPVILILALITLFVAAAIFINTFLLKGLKKEPTPVSTPSIQPSPKSTTDETANWKTFKNDKYGYSIKFPQGWEVTDLVLEHVDIIDKNESEGLSISIIDHSLIKFVDIEDWLKYINGQQSDLTRVVDSQKITLDDTEAYLIRFESKVHPDKDDVVDIYNVITIRDGLQIRILHTLDSVETFNQILSTFQFLN